MEKFEGDTGRAVEFLHVKAHTGVQGNERADELAAMGSKLRHELMIKSQPKGWFRTTVEMYYNNMLYARGCGCVWLTNILQFFLPYFCFRRCLCMHIPPRSSMSTGPVSFSAASIIPGLLMCALAG